jgi:hypothetical protein
MNVDGPFYVTDFCIICFTPPEIAPRNILEHYKPHCSAGCPHSSCYVGKQPENDEELELMIEAMEMSCVRAIRYCGTDPVVIEKLSARGLAEQCDAMVAEPGDTPNDGPVPPVENSDDSGDLDRSACS